MGYYPKHNQTQAASKAIGNILTAHGFQDFDPVLLQRQLIEGGFNHLEDFAAHAKKILGYHKKAIEDELGDQIS